MFPRIVLGPISDEVRCDLHDTTPDHEDEMAEHKYVEGVENYDNDRIDEAIDSLIQSVGIEPNNPRPYFYLCLAFQIRRQDGDDRRAMDAGEMYWDMLILHKKPFVNVNDKTDAPETKTFTPQRLFQGLLDMSKDKTPAVRYEIEVFDGGYGTYRYHLIRIYENVEPNLTVSQVIRRDGSYNTFEDAVRRAMDAFDMFHRFDPIPDFLTKPLTTSKG